MNESIPMMESHNNDELLPFNLKCKSYSHIDSVHLLTPLMISVIKMDLTLTKKLVADGANIYKLNNRNFDAFTYACLYDNIAAVKWLLSEIARTESQKMKLSMINRSNFPKEFTSLLIWACRARSISVANYLIDQGAEINAMDTQNYTALHWCCVTDMVETAQKLIDKHVNLNVFTITGYSALDFAYIHNRKNLIRILRRLKIGIQYSLVDKYDAVDCVEAHATLIPKNYKIKIDIIDNSAPDCYIETIATQIYA